MASAKARITQADLDAYIEQLAVANAARDAALAALEQTEQKLHIWGHWSLAKIAHLKEKVEDARADTAHDARWAKKPYVKPPLTKDQQDRADKMAIARKAAMDGNTKVTVQF